MNDTTTPVICEFCWNAIHGPRVGQVLWFREAEKPLTRYFHPEHVAEWLIEEAKQGRSWMQ